MAGPSEDLTWNRYSILVTRCDNEPALYRVPDGTAAWSLAHASRRARVLAKQKNVEKVEVVPAAPDDVADWQKTPMANRGMLPTIEGIPRDKKERIQWICAFVLKNSPR
jgi:hypothetical protein